MAQNDMFVVMAQIIAYLYDCMKEGKTPKLSDWSAEACGVNQRYWTKIVSQLVEDDFISGVQVVKTSMGDTINAYDPAVTRWGVQFARENSGMAKAVEFLRNGGGILANLVLPFV